MLRAMDLKDGLELDDGTVTKGGEPAKPGDVPIRTDLKKSHPLHGKRCLRVVPAGMPDCTVDDQGNLVPIEVERERPVPVEVDRGR